MAVGNDTTMLTGNSADGFNQQVSGATSISSTGINVGAAATGLIACLTFNANVGSVAATWNAVGMTLGPNVNSGVVRSSILSLPNPASGAQALAASWTTAADCYMSAASFTGTDTSTVVKVADNITAINTTTITVTSDTAGATVANFAVDGGAPTVNFTKIYSEAPLGPGGGASYTLGGTSNAHTFTGAGGTVQALTGVHILAPSAGDTSTPFLNFLF